jgi:uncharacterized protein
MSAAADQGLAEKVRFLAAPGALAPGEQALARETHMSWVFLTQDRVFKFKKPVRFPYLDFSSLAAREAACREELRLNQVLAPDVYLRLARLTRADDGGLELDGAGETAEWLIVMRRLPQDSMLDARLKSGAASPADIERTADRLIAFYRAAPPVALSADFHVDKLRKQFALDREVITARRFDIDHGRGSVILDQLDGALEQLAGRVRARTLTSTVEGHGDLRPEHVCIDHEVRIIDRLEFDRTLRLIDPFDELAFLGMECAVAGAPWVAPILITRARAQLAAPDDDLIGFYRASRASLRARLALAHLFDAEPREPAKWAPLAARYLDQAALSLRLPTAS